jgi:hypothetical protein
MIARPLVASGGVFSLLLTGEEWDEESSQAFGLSFKKNSTAL